MNTYTCGSELMVHHVLGAIVKNNGVCTKLVIRVLRDTDKGLIEDTVDVSMFPQDEGGSVTITREI